MNSNGVAQSGLARLNGVQEVGGSNPLAPTEKISAGEDQRIFFYSPGSDEFLSRIANAILPNNRALRDCHPAYLELETQARQHVG